MASPIRLPKYQQYKVMILDKTEEQKSILNPPAGGLDYKTMTPCQQKEAHPKGV